MSKERFKLGKKETEHLLQLINIYLSEWDHRATALWSQVFKYFYATLFVLFLPIMANHFEIDLSEFPKWIFSIAAFILSAIFLYVSWGCAKRAKAIGDTYKKLVEQLPEELHRVSTSEPAPMSFVICVLMFVVLAGLSVIMFLHYVGFI